ncbi:MAG: SH3 domain-containing protein, partial [Candidatus Aegiribacteria sp.]
GDTVVTEEPPIPEHASVWNTVTVTGSVVNLRSGPGTIYEVVGQVSRDDTLQVTGGLEDWYRVYIPEISMFAWIYGPLTTGTELP